MSVMAPQSVSFRISRSAEDLAETIHALSQRLVSLEQRLVAMERQLAQPDHADPEEVASLDNVERLLRDCRDLLDDGDSGLPITAAQGAGGSGFHQEGDARGGDPIRTAA